MQFSGFSLVGTSGVTSHSEGAAFHGFDPCSGVALDPPYLSASQVDVERAAALAHQAFGTTKTLAGSEKARFLRRIADKLDGAKEIIVARAALETALPLARVIGELGRTTSQLRLFADVAESGLWLDARIDTPDATRQPLPKPDVRSMLRPLGPVVVFGASNFPLAFSVAGGDTAAAFAAGCPVIVKAHPAHPATSEMVGQLICEAARECGLPEGTFSLLFDAKYEVGIALVTHPHVKAVGFTGSRHGGMALMQAAASRPSPIPVFAEMSSINPIFITPGALQERGLAIASGLHAAVTQGVGQFCTNPGLVLLPQGEAGDAFVEQLRVVMGETAAGSMLTAGICRAYGSGVEKLGQSPNITAHLQPVPGKTASAGLFEISVADLRAESELMDEVFGPSTLVARYQNQNELLEFVSILEGQLTATLQIAGGELASHAELVGALEDKVGRLLINGFPTGVEVGHAMVHGGPFPATSDGQSTSVGTRAITRFARPVCFQNFPEAALPPALQSANPLGILRLVNGQATRDAL